MSDSGSLSASELSEAGSGSARSDAGSARANSDDDARGNSGDSGAIEQVGRLAHEARQLEEAAAQQRADAESRAYWDGVGADVPATSEPVEGETGTGESPPPVMVDNKRMPARMRTIGEAVNSATRSGYRTNEQEDIDVRVENALLQLPEDSVQQIETRRDTLQDLLPVIEQRRIALWDAQNRLRTFDRQELKWQEDLRRAHGIASGENPDGQEDVKRLNTKIRLRLIGYTDDVIGGNANKAFLLEAIRKTEVEGGDLYTVRAVLAYLRPLLTRTTHLVRAASQSQLRIGIMRKQAALKKAAEKADERRQAQAGRWKVSNVRRAIAEAKKLRTSAERTAMAKARLAQRVRAEEKRRAADLEIWMASHPGKASSDAPMGIRPPTGAPTPPPLPPAGGVDRGTLPASPVLLVAVGDTDQYVDQVLLDRALLERRYHAEPQEDNPSGQYYAATLSGRSPQDRPWSTLGRHLQTLRPVSDRSAQAGSRTGRITLGGEPTAPAALTGWHLFTVDLGEQGEDSLAVPAFVAVPLGGMAGRPSSASSRQLPAAEHVQLPLDPSRTVNLNRWAQTPNEVHESRLAGGGGSAPVWDVQEKERVWVRLQQDAEHPEVRVAWQHRSRRYPGDELDVETEAESRRHRRPAEQRRWDQVLEARRQAGEGRQWIWTPAEVAQDLVASGTYTQFVRLEYSLNEQAWVSFVRAKQHLADLKANGAPLGDEQSRVLRRAEEDYRRVLASIQQTAGVSWERSQSAEAALRRVYGAQQYTEMLAVVEAARLSGERAENERRAAGPREGPVWVVGNTVSLHVQAPVPLEEAKRWADGGAYPTGSSGVDAPTPVSRPGHAYVAGTADWRFEWRRGDQAPPPPLRPSMSWPLGARGVFTAGQADTDSELPSPPLVAFERTVGPAPTASDAGRELYVSEGEGDTYTLWAVVGQRASAQGRPAQNARDDIIRHRTLYWKLAEEKPQTDAALANAKKALVDVTPAGGSGDELRSPKATRAADSAVATEAKLQEAQQERDGLATAATGDTGGDNSDAGSSGPGPEPAAAAQRELALENAKALVATLEAEQTTARAALAAADASADKDYIAASKASAAAYKKSGAIASQMQQALSDMNEARLRLQLAELRDNDASDRGTQMDGLIRVRLHGVLAEDLLYCVRTQSLYSERSNTYNSARWHIHSNPLLGSGLQVFPPGQGLVAALLGRVPALGQARRVTWDDVKELLAVQEAAGNVAVLPGIEYLRQLDAKMACVVKVIVHDRPPGHQWPGLAGVWQEGDRRGPLLYYLLFARELDAHGAACTEALADITEREMRDEPDRTKHSTVQQRREQLRDMDPPLLLDSISGGNERAMMALAERFDQAQLWVGPPPPGDPRRPATRYGGPEHNDDALRREERLHAGPRDNPAVWGTAPLVYWGLSGPRVEFGGRRKWRCCKQDEGAAGCFEGRHSSRTLFPDPMALMSADNPAWGAPRPAAPPPRLLLPPPQYADDGMAGFLDGWAEAQAAEAAAERQRQQEAERLRLLEADRLRLLRGNGEGRAGGGGGTSPRSKPLFTLKQDEDVFTSEQMWKGTIQAITHVLIDGNEEFIKLYQPVHSDGHTFIPVSQRPLQYTAAVQRSTDGRSMPSTFGPISAFLKVPIDDGHGLIAPLITSKHWVALLRVRRIDGTELRYLMDPLDGPTAPGAKAMAKLNSDEGMQGKGKFTFVPFGVQQDHDKGCGICTPAIVAHVIDRGQSSPVDGVLAALLEGTSEQTTEYTDTQVRSVQPDGRVVMEPDPESATVPMRRPTDAAVEAVNALREWLITVREDVVDLTGNDEGVDARGDRTGRQRAGVGLDEEGSSRVDAEPRRAYRIGAEEGGQDGGDQPTVTLARVDGVPDKVHDASQVILTAFTGDWGPIYHSRSGSYNDRTGAPAYTVEHSESETTLVMRFPADQAARWAEYWNQWVTIHIETPQGQQIVATEDPDKLTIEVMYSHPPAAPDAGEDLPPADHAHAEAPDRPHGVIGHVSAPPLRHDAFGVAEHARLARLRHQQATRWEMDTRIGSRWTQRLQGHGWLAYYDGFGGAAQLRAEWDHSGTRTQLVRVGGIRRGNPAGQAERVVEMDWAPWLRISSAQNSRMSVFGDSEDAPGPSEAWGAEKQWNDTLAYTRAYDTMTAEGNMITVRDPTREWEARVPLSLDTRTQNYFYTGLLENADVKQDDDFRRSLSRVEDAESWDETDRRARDVDGYGGSPFGKDQAGIMERYVRDEKRNRVPGGSARIVREWLGRGETGQDQSQRQRRADTRGQDPRDLVRLLSNDAGDAIVHSIGHGTVNLVQTDCVLETGHIGDRRFWAMRSGALQFTRVHIDASRASTQGKQGTLSLLLDIVPGDDELRDTTKTTIETVYAVTAHSADAGHRSVSFAVTPLRADSRTEAPSPLQLKVDSAVATSVHVLSVVRGDGNLSTLDTSRRSHTEPSVDIYGDGFLSTPPPVLRTTVRRPPSGGVNTPGLSPVQRAADTRYDATGDATGFDGNLSLNADSLAASGTRAVPVIMPMSGAAGRIQEMYVLTTGALEAYYASGSLDFFVSQATKMHSLYDDWARSYAQATFHLTRELYAQLRAASTGAEAAVDAAGKAATVAMASDHAADARRLEEHLRRAAALHGETTDVMEMLRQAYLISANTMRAMALAWYPAFSRTGDATVDDERQRAIVSLLGAGIDSTSNLKVIVDVKSFLREHIDKMRGTADTGTQLASSTIMDISNETEAITAQYVTAADGLAADYGEDSAPLAQLKAGADDAVEEHGRVVQEWRRFVDTKATVGQVFTAVKRLADDEQVGPAAAPLPFLTEIERRRLGLERAANTVTQLSAEYINSLASLTHASADADVIIGQVRPFLEPPPTTGGVASDHTEAAAALDGITDFINRSALTNSATWDTGAMLENVRKTASDLLSHMAVYSIEASAYMVSVGRVTDQTTTSGDEAGPVPSPLKRAVADEFQRGADAIKRVEQGAQSAASPAYLEATGTVGVPLTPNQVASVRRTSTPGEKGAYGIDRALTPTFNAEERQTHAEYAVKIEAVLEAVGAQLAAVRGSAGDIDVDSMQETQALRALGVETQTPSRRSARMKARGNVPVVYTHTYKSAAMAQAVTDSLRKRKEAGDGIFARITTAQQSATLRTRAALTKTETVLADDPIARTINFSPAPSGVPKRSQDAADAALAEKTTELAEDLVGIVRQLRALNGNTQSASLTALKNLLNDVTVGALTRSTDGNNRMYSVKFTFGTSFSSGDIAAVVSVISGQRARLDDAPVTAVLSEDGTFIRVVLTETTQGDDGAGPAPPAAAGDTATNATGSGGAGEVPALPAPSAAAGTDNNEQTEDSGTGMRLRRPGKDPASAPGAGDDTTTHGEDGAADLAGILVQSARGRRNENVDVAATAPAMANNVSVQGRPNGRLTALFISTVEFAGDALNKAMRVQKKVRDILDEGEGTVSVTGNDRNAELTIGQDPGPRSPGNMTMTQAGFVNTLFSGIGAGADARTDDAGRQATWYSLSPDLRPSAALVGAVVAATVSAEPEARGRARDYMSAYGLRGSEGRAGNENVYYQVQRPTPAGEPHWLTEGYTWHLHDYLAAAMRRYGGEVTMDMPPTPPEETEYPEVEMRLQYPKGGIGTSTVAPPPVWFFSADLADLVEGAGSDRPTDAQMFSDATVMSVASLPMHGRVPADAAALAEAGWLGWQIEDRSSRDAELRSTFLDGDPTTTLDDVTVTELPVLHYGLHHDWIAEDSDDEVQARLVDLVLRVNTLLGGPFLAQTPERGDVHLELSWRPGEPGFSYELPAAFGGRPHTDGEEPLDGDLQAARTLPQMAADLLRVQKAVRDGLVNVRAIYRGILPAVFTDKLKKKGREAIDRLREDGWSVLSDGYVEMRPPLGQKIPQELRDQLAGSKEGDTGKSAFTTAELGERRVRLEVPVYSEQVMNMLVYLMMRTRRQDGRLLLEATRAWSVSEVGEVTHARADGNHTYRYFTVRRHPLRWPNGRTEADLDARLLADMRSRRPELAAVLSLEAPNLLRFEYQDTATKTRPPPGFDARAS